MSTVEEWWEAGMIPFSEYPPKRTMWWDEVGKMSSEEAWAYIEEIRKMPKPSEEDFKMQLNQYPLTPDQCFKPGKE